MFRLNLARCLALGAALSAALIAACTPPAPRAPKHVLLMVIDTQRADRLGSYGNTRGLTPVLDALAREGVVFENCVSQASWTSPSMVSMMSGQAISEEVMTLPENKPTLAERFAAQGWRTGGFVCNNILDEKHGFGRGFEEFQCQLPPYGENAPILEWLRSRKDERTFTWIHLNEVHDEKHPELGPTYWPVPPERWRKWRDVREGIPGAREQYYSSISERLRLQDGAASRERIQADLGGYDDDVRYEDNRISEIFAELKQLGLWDDTLIVIAADHGEGLYTREQFLSGTRKAALERGEAPTLVSTLQMTHGSQGYWELIHVPLILKSPGIAPARVAGYVENLDIAPTLVELAQLGASEELQGRSLVPVALDPDEAGLLAPQVFSYTRYHSGVITQSGLHLLVPSPRGECDFGLVPELYDLRRDPECRRNLLHSGGREGGEAARLAAELDPLLHRREAQGLHGAPTQLDEGTQSKLAGLGYIGSEVVDQLRSELLGKSTEVLLEDLERTYAHDCLLRHEVARALSGRKLQPEERTRIEAVLRQEPSAAVQAALRKLL
jgi:arylsulfatase A-like enzyme